jgi:hypothetical protein
LIQQSQRAEIRDNRVYIAVEQFSLDGSNMKKIMNHRIFFDHTDFITTDGDVITMSKEEAAPIEQMIADTNIAAINSLMKGEGGDAKDDDD